MTNDQILQVAKEVYDYDFSETVVQATRDRLITFAHRIAELEREACAQVCEETDKQTGAWFAENIRSRK